MSTNTTHFNLKKYEGSDKFNPLTFEAANMALIDDALWANKLAAITTATETKLGVNHNLAILTANTDVPMFRFTATADFDLGDTVTVNNTTVTALTPAGTALPDGAWVIGSEVLCCLRDTRLTVFVTNVGQIDLSNYVTFTDLAPVETTADTALTTANAASTTASAANTLATQVQNTVSGMFSGITAIAYVPSLPSNPDATTLYLIPEA